MAVPVRFGHVNVIAQDWRRLQAFYEQVFGCTPVPPERNLTEPWVEEVTGVPGARIRGVHLRLPGHGDTGPTLEILQYAEMEPRPITAANRPGFAHIAFAVGDIDAVLSALLAAGGGTTGGLVSAEIPGAGKLRLVYATDPEGNIVELQQWQS